jgi:NAD(P)-dependent dehydrogenase (short-subunit alcohol dehydrogenase family)
LADGWQVYAACRNPQSASELRRLADASDDKLQILALDVIDPVSVQAAAAKLDGQAIDLLLNNAGIGGPRGQSVGNIDYEAWAKVLDVNTMGPLRVSEAFVDHVARSERKQSSPLPAAWDRLPTTLQEARSPIAAQKPR